MKFKIIVEYKNKKYSLIEEWKEKYSWESELEGVRYMYDEGNYSCDCNKSLFIQRQCDPKFPEMKCGDKIKLLSIELV